MVQHPPACVECGWPPKERGYRFTLEEAARLGLDHREGFCRYCWEKLLNRLWRYDAQAYDDLHNSIGDEHDAKWRTLGRHRHAC